MGNIARVEIKRGKEGWEACHPFGCTWGTSFFHGPNNLKEHAVENFWDHNALHPTYDDAVVLVETELGWF